VCALMGAQHCVVEQRINVKRCESDEHPSICNVYKQSMMHLTGPYP
jgi:hypothetical protein